MSEKLLFIVGGVQKCGTTALFEYLSQHPALSRPSHKELHFFDNEGIDWSAPDYELMHRCFSGSGHRFEVTPIYLFWPGAIARIRAYRADIRLVFLFRDPIERAFSHWCMEYARGSESLTFQDAIRKGRERIERGDPHRLRYWSYVERGLYGQQVAALLTNFPKSQALFLSSAALANDHIGVLRQITDFVGVEPFDGVAALQAFTSPANDYPSSLERDDVGLLRDLYRKDIADFSALTGIDVSTWLTVRRS